MNIAELDGRDTRAWPRIVIVGAGFAGLAAARRLQKVPVEVTLIDRNNFHTFSPLLYQVATAGLEPEEIAQPVRSMLRHAPHVHFRMGEVIRIDFGRRAVVLDNGQIAFDYLILAAGSAASYFGLADIAAHSLCLKDLAEATALRDHVLLSFERAATEQDPHERQRLMTIAVVGGGPTGVELAGALAELKRHVLSHDYPELPVDSQARVILIEATNSLLGSFPSGLGRSAFDQLQRMGVDIRLNASVSEVTDKGVQIAHGEFLACASTIWVAGARGALLGDTLGIPLAGARRVAVEKTLQLPAWPNVFAVGDLAYLERANGLAYPMLAPVAIQQGRMAAANILRLMQKQPLKEFVYRDFGTMATVGRQAAVASIGPLKFTGFIAWVLWLTVHLVWLIGFRNRLLVLTNWAWNYVFYEHGARLISRENLGPKGHR